MGRYDLTDFEWEAIKPLIFQQATWGAAGR